MYAQPGRAPRRWALRIAVLVAMIAAAGLGGAAPGSAAECDGVPLAPGDDIAAALASHPIKTTFCFAPGVYRVTEPLLPQRNDTLIGAPGATIDGARRVKGWARRGSVWVAHHRSQGPTIRTAGWGTDELIYPQAQYADDVSIDNEPLWKVGVKVDGAIIGSSVVGPGEYFIDYDANKITLGSDPVGHLVEQGFADGGIEARAAGVTIDGLTVEGTQGIGIDADGSGWTISNSTARLNHVTGIHVTEGTQVLGDTVSGNGAFGVTGKGDGVTVDGSTITENDAARFGSIHGGCDGAGGSKFVNSHDLTITNNTFSDNWCTGIWLDTNDDQVTVAHNVSTGNRADGIRLEIGYDVAISDNTVQDNGRGGITVVDSPRVTISGNRVSGNLGTEIMLQQHERIDPVSPLGPHLMRNAKVTGNEVWLSGSQVAGARDTDKPRQDAVFTSYHNHFAGNTYHVPAADSHSFLWLGEKMTFAQWRTAGQDHTGSLVVGS